EQGESGRFGAGQSERTLQDAVHQMVDTGVDGADGWEVVLPEFPVYSAKTLGGQQRAPAIFVHYDLCVVLWGGVGAITLYGLVQQRTQLGVPQASVCPVACLIDEVAPVWWTV